MNPHFYIAFAENAPPPPSNKVTYIFLSFSFSFFFLDENWNPNIGYTKSINKYTKSLRVGQIAEL